MSEEYEGRGRTGARGWERMPNEAVEEIKKLEGLIEKLVQIVERIEQRLEERSGNGAA